MLLGVARNPQQVNRNFIIGDAYDKKKKGKHTMKKVLSLLLVLLMLAGMLLSCQKNDEEAGNGPGSIEKEEFDPEIRTITAT